MSGSVWRAAPIVEWVLMEGRRNTRAAPFIDGLANRLQAAGVPLWRLRLGFRTLHPLVAAWGYVWYRGNAATETQVLHGIELSDAYQGSPIQHVNQTRTLFRRRLGDLTNADHPVLHEIAAAGGTDYLCVPMVFSTGHTNVFIVTTDQGEFTDHDIREFASLVDAVTPVLEVYAMRRLARGLLDTYLGHRTGERVLNGLIKRGDSETIRAALWFSDLRDFTRLTETLASRQLLAMLNEYFELVAAAVEARGGEILRFIGDAMLIVFPVGPDLDDAAVCQAALESALDATANGDVVNHRRRRANLPPIRFGVGLHVGEVIYGNVGAPARLDFTVMGSAVNRTARLETLTKTVGVPLLMSVEFARHMTLAVESRGTYAMHGIDAPQEVFALTGHGVVLPPEDNSNRLA